jgi:hypothetical protein
MICTGVAAGVPVFALAFVFAVVFVPVPAFFPLCVTTAELPFEPPVVAAEPPVIPPA